MIAIDGAYPRKPIRPVPLQDAGRGTYGSVPPPSGASSTGIRMTAPQFNGQPAPLAGGLQRRRPAPSRLAAPAPRSPATAGSPPPSAPMAPPPRMAPPTNVNPSLAGTSTLTAPPSNINPIPTGGQQFQPPPPPTPPPPAAAPPPAQPVGTVPQGTTAVSGARSTMLAPPPAPAPGAPTAAAAPAGVVPAGTTAVSGAEVPYHVGAGPSDASSSMLSKLATEAGRQLDQPTVYDDALAKQIKDSESRGINTNYDRARTSLDAGLADRGINYSTIAGGNIMDLESERAGALSDVDTRIGRERANALAAGRSAAFSNARGVFGDQTGVDQLARENQIGERGYADELRRKAQEDALYTTQLGETYGRQADQSFQDILNQGYGYGTSTAGSGVLAGAGGMYGGQADRYGESQAADQQGLAELAELAARFFGQKAP